MIFIISLYLALGVFLFGLAYRISRWFTTSIALTGKSLSPAKRFTTALKGVLGTLLSKRVTILMRSFFLDVLFQKRLLSASPYRWASHLLVFWGFSYLLIVHALEALTIRPHVLDYSSTQNPFLFMRNLATLFVLIGLIMMIRRKNTGFIGHVKRKSADRLLILLLATLLLSGLALEGAKITSESRFKEMVTEYSDEDDPNSINALEFYWAKYYGVVPSKSISGNPEELLARGKELHETSCASCHVRPQWAFLGYGVAKGLSPIATRLDQVHAGTVLWYLHFFVAFVALALFPFTKLLHLLVSPVSLLTNSVMDDDRSDPINIATRQAMELDACTHCGLCTQVCAVQTAYYHIPNVNILPSEKLAHLNKIKGKKDIAAKEISVVLEGLYLCTNCHRCTDVCPVGINLQAMWFNVRETFLQKGIPEPLTLTPLSFFRGLSQDKIDPSILHLPLLNIRSAIEYSCDSEEKASSPIVLKDLNQDGKRSLITSERGRSLSYCYTCTSCSSACPVARVVDDAPKDLGLLPHQIIRAINLGLTDIVFRSEMLWSCLGCYMCQDACPQGVRVTDIISELKVLASTQVRNYLFNHTEVGS